MEKINDKLINDLSEKILNLSKDYDAYEFRDNFDNEEEAYEYIQDILTKGDINGIESMKTFCDYHLNQISLLLNEDKEDVDLMY